MQKNSCVEVDGRPLDIEILSIIENEVCFRLGDKEFSFSLVRPLAQGFVMSSQRDGRHHIVSSVPGEEGQVRSTVILVDGNRGNLRVVKKRRPGEGEPSSSREADPDRPQEIPSPMPGKIFKILKKAGDIVAKGETLIIMEAMKMEHSLKANFDGIVEAVLCQEQDVVPRGRALVRLRFQERQ